MFPSVCQDVHPRMSAHCNGRCFSCAVQAHTLPWQSVDGISSTNDEYVTPLTPRTLRFKAALSGSRTKCGIVYGLWKAVLRLPEFCHLVWTGFGNQTNIVDKYVFFSAVLHVAEKVPTRRLRTDGVMKTLWWVSSWWLSCLSSSCCEQQ